MLIESDREKWQSSGTNFSMSFKYTVWEFPMSPFLVQASHHSKRLKENLL